MLFCQIEYWFHVKSLADFSPYCKRFNLINHKEITDRDFRNVISELINIFKKPICTAPSTGYFVACGEEEKQVSLNYLDSILTEVGDRRRTLAAAIPLGHKQTQEKLF